MTGKSGSRGDDEDETAVQVTNKKQTKVAAKKIFINVSKQGSKYQRNLVSLHIGIFKMVAHAQKEVKPQID
nr:mechanosensitive ion channel protein 6-like [Tanacetum cinerariifolium]